MLTKNQWTALLERTPDRRELIAHAALELQISEDELLQRLSKRSGTPTIKRLHPMECCNDASTIRELRALGALFILKGSRIDGVACIDPSALAPISEKISGAPIYLAAWRAIEKALELSETQSNLASSKEGGEREKKRLKVAHEVLAIIAKEVTGSGTSKFYLERFGDGLDYSFKPLTEPSLKKGRIHPKITETVWGLVASGRTIQLIEDGNAEKLFLSPAQLEAALIEINISERNPAEKVLKVVETPELPRRVQKTEERLAEVVQFPRPRSEKPLMVIIEDNVDFARVLTRYFKRYPVEITHYTDGALAFNDIVEEKILPDLTICDLHMPSMHGLEFIKRIRVDLKAAGLPIIMLTSDDELETQVRLVESGADVFLTKSTHPRVLEAHVRRILNVAPVSSAIA